MQSRYTLSRNNAEITSRPAYQKKKKRIILTIYSQHQSLTGIRNPRSLNGRGEVNARKQNAKR